MRRMPLVLSLVLRWAAPGLAQSPSRFTVGSVANIAHVAHAGSGLALTLAAVFVVIAPIRLHAQSSVQGLGYGIGGLAGYSGFFGSNIGSIWHVAGGGEVLARGRAGAAGEFGVLLGGNGALAVASLNGVFHLLPSRRDRSVSPFATGGYTHMWNGESAFDAWNIGGGLDIWPRSGPGFRLDIRDHLRPDTRGSVHYWSLRAGVTFGRP